MWPYEKLRCWMGFFFIFFHFFMLCFCQLVKCHNDINRRPAAAFSRVVLKSTKTTKGTLRSFGVLALQWMLHVLSHSEGNAAVQTWNMRLSGASHSSWLMIASLLVHDSKGSTSIPSLFSLEICSCLSYTSGHGPLWNVSQTVKCGGFNSNDTRISWVTNKWNYQHSRISHCLR